MSIKYFEQPPTVRWWKWVVGIISIATVGILGSMFWGGHFEVQNIEVLGTREDVQAEIEKTAWEIINRDAVLSEATNVFLVPRRRMEEILSEVFPIIRTVHVLRELPGNVRIVVQERVPVALLFAGGTYYSLDETGLMFEIVPPETLQERGLPVLRDQRNDVDLSINQQVVLPEVLSTLHTVITTLPERFSITINYVEIPAIGTQELHIATHEDWMLLIDTTRSLDDQFTVMAKVFTELLSEDERAQLEYLDLRVAGKAFYR